MQRIIVRKNRKLPSITASHFKKKIGNEGEEENTLVTQMLIVSWL